MVQSGHFHLFFTTLDLSFTSNITFNKLYSNITAFQLFDTNNKHIEHFFMSINYRLNCEKKATLSYKPVFFFVLNSSF